MKKITIITKRQNVLEKIASDLATPTVGLRLFTRERL